MHRIGLRHRTRAPILLLASAALGACGDAGAERGVERSAIISAAPIVITDASGRAVRFDHPPARVLSLVPTVTQILVELGTGYALVGRTDYDTMATVRALPSVGGGLQPDLERLLTLRPDLVIRFEGAQDPVTGVALDERSIPHLTVRPDRIADVIAIVHQMGQIMGRSEAADTLVADLDRQLADVRALVAGAERPRVAYVLGGTPPWVAGPGTFIADLLDAAGGENVFADLDRLYGPVSLEELVTRDVTFFVVARGTVVNLRLGEQAPVVEVSQEVESPGTGLGRAALELAHLLHPAAFR
jgi:iron complex transport system substrate-binding protein